MLQTTFNGIITGVIMTLPALAVTLLFGVLKFPNFAVGAMMTVAAYMAFALNAQLGWPLLPATAAAALAMGALCIGIDSVTFKPLRERGAITLMVASLGLGFILENIARFAYGNSARSFAIELARPFRFADVRMNQEQMITLGVSTAAMIAMWLLLTRSPMGRAMRAVADNPSLALVRGIESPRVIRWTWFIAGVLLAVGGVLIGMDRARAADGQQLPDQRVRGCDPRGAWQPARRLRRRAGHRRGERALHPGGAAELPHRRAAVRHRGDPDLPPPGLVRLAVYT